MNFLFRRALFSNSASFVDGPGFGMRRKQVEIQVPQLPAEFRAPPACIPSPSPSPAPPVASSSCLRKQVLCKFHFRTFYFPIG